MNIVIAADYTAPTSGNFIASCVELGRALQIRGDGLAFIFPESRNTLVEDSWVGWLKREGFPVYLVSADLNDPQRYTFLRDVLRKQNAEILHIHFGLFHREAIRHTKELGVRILIHDHMGFPADGAPAKYRVRCLALSLLYRIRGICIVSVSPEKNRIYRMAKHCCIPNGLSRFRNVAGSLSREQMRQELGLRPEEKLCLFLGWDPRGKGLDIALQAVKERRKVDPGLILGIVGMGTGPGEAGAEFICAAGVDPHEAWIRYLPSREDMFAYHRAADVYLSASRSEAFSYGILEAISQNTPVAASDIRGTAWCHAYSKAVVYPTEEVPACAAAIGKALDMGRSDSNAEDIAEQYSIANWCERMLAVYRRL